jgi:pimeloyl-ACP methyl ester carboxylesterase
MGSACWDDAAKALRAAGAEVLTLDLPAHGADTTPVSQTSLAAYVAAVQTAIDGANAPVILVGHSLGGMVISEVAAQHPETIARLVYLAAYLPADGQSLFDLAMTDPDSRIGPSLVINADSTIDVAHDAFPDLFCADCTGDARQALLDGYRAEPAAPLQDKAAVTAASGQVPKTYIHTTQDRVVSPALQDRMIAAATAVDRTASLDASHAAMLAQPQALATILLAQ